MNFSSDSQSSTTCKEKRFDYLFAHNLAMHSNWDDDAQSDLVDVRAAFEVPNLNGALLNCKQPDARVS